MVAAGNRQSRSGSSCQRATPPDSYDNWDDYWRAVGVSEDELGLGLDRIADSAGRGPRIWFQVVPEKKTRRRRWRGRAGSSRSTRPRPGTRSRNDAMIGNPLDAAQLGCTWPSADTREARNLRSRPVIRMILTSDGLGEATPNGQPFCFA
jgi:hypothetical protein